MRPLRWTVAAVLTAVAVFWFGAEALFLGCMKYFAWKDNRHAQ